MSEANRKGQVGIIGLGIMGGAIAKNLATAGWHVIGFDIAKDRCDEAKAAGAKTLDEYLSQGGLFGDTKYTPEQVRMAKHLRNTKQAELSQAAKHYADDAEFIVKVPQGLKHVGVLLEPTTVVEKGIHQAYEIQRRLKVWRPRKAAVMGAGTIGLLATLVLRLKGLDVTTFGRTAKPYLNSDLIEELGARYASTSPATRCARRRTSTAT